MTLLPCLVYWCLLAILALTSENLNRDVTRKTSMGKREERMEFKTNFFSPKHYRWSVREYHNKTFLNFCLDLRHSQNKLCECIFFRLLSFGQCITTCACFEFRLLYFLQAEVKILQKADWEVFVNLFDTEFTHFSGWRRTCIFQIQAQSIVWFLDIH